MNRESLPMNWLLIRDRIKILRQKLSRSHAVQWLITSILAQYIRFVWFTSRHEIEMAEGARPYYEGEKNAVYAFWHGRLVLIPLFKPHKRSTNVLISQHNDGELIAKTVAGFGIHTVRGSTSSGGSKAVRDLVQLFRAGGNLTITPDGPRGPNREAQAGVVHIARLCKSPILCITFSCSRNKALRSWDRMQIPLPFSKVIARVSDPIFLPQKPDEAAIETCRKAVEETLNAITNQVDEMVGMSEERRLESASQRSAKPR